MLWPRPVQATLARHLPLRFALCATFKAIKPAWSRCLRGVPLLAAPDPNNPGRLTVSSVGEIVGVLDFAGISVSWISVWISVSISLQADGVREPNSLEWYLEHHERDEAIVRAYRDGGHTQTAIAKAAHLSVSRISRLLAAREAKGKT